MQTTKEKSVCAVKQNKKNTNDISEKAISTQTLIKLFIWKSVLPSSLGNNGGSTKLIGLMLS